MRKIILIQLLLIIISCHSQEKEKVDKKIKDRPQSIQIETSINPKTMQTYTTEKFDIENYFKHKNKESGSYEYVDKNGYKVYESDIDGYTFLKDITPLNSLFITHKKYFKNGSLNTMWETFGQYGFIKGNKYEYDEQGKVTKVEDWDKPFKFKWEQVKKYIENNLKLDLLKDQVVVTNNFILQNNTSTWEVNFKGKYKDVFGVYYLTLDGADGELLKVIKILGRDGEKQIIYEKK
ncbi:hypothetical protein [Chryseobacterium bernardetii]|uniref:hypothetical protein n=1 Tax=Chryseobacterium bernardetii TaxID=1241978 RepID=UPI001623FD55|nr:hypothetical protein [Chryseobacterium bernardetii]